MNSGISKVLSGIKAPKALQSGVDGGYILRQTPDAENGAPVFAGSTMADVAHLTKTAPDTDKKGAKKS